jgi:hypothetical protein
MTSSIQEHKEIDNQTLLTNMQYIYVAANKATKAGAYDIEEAFQLRNAINIISSFITTTTKQQNSMITQSKNANIS